MDKYTEKQLGEMAREALAARNVGDARWIKLVFTLSVKANLSPKGVETRIKYMAENW